MKNKTLSKILNNQIFYLFLLIFIIIYVSIRSNLEKPSTYKEDDKYFEGTIRNVKFTKERISLELNSKENLICNYYLTENEKEYGYDDFPIGSKINIRGKLKKPLNNTIPNTFNYKKYLNHREIHYTCEIEEFTLNTDEINLLNKIKNAVIKRIATYKIRDYMMTLIIGNKDLLDETTLENYKDNGIVHLFAISGMHIGLASSLLLSLFKKIKIPKKLALILTVIAIWFYAFLTGFSSSVLRAGLLFSLISVNKIFSLKIENIYILLLVGAILIFSNYHILYDVGFIFSFVTTFGPIYHKDILKKHKILGTTLVAFLYSLPIGCSNFYKFNLGSIAYNILFVPFVSTIVYPLCLLTFLIRPLEIIAIIAISFLEFLNTFLASIDFLTFIIPKLPIFIVVIYYAILIAHLRKNLLKVSIFLISLILSTKLIPILDFSDHVDFLDVGQGDSTLIRTKHSKEVILIDTGGQINYGKKEDKHYIGENIVTYLHSLGINKIDYIFLTHGDIDHVGETLHIANSVKVDSIIMNNGSINELENKILRHSKVRKRYYDGKLNIKNLNDNIWNDENSNSIVFSLSLGSLNFLFTGDVPKKVETYILKNNPSLRADVIKLAHHGSKTSSEDTFLKSIEAKTAIISSGRKNIYAHPDDETVNTLKKLDIEYFNTQTSGTISYKIGKKDVTIKRCPP